MVNIMKDSSGTRSIEELLKLLGNVAEEPGAHASNAKLLSALNSQGGLAAYGDSARKIVAMSLNHQKKLAADCGIGFAKVDEMRRRARDAMAKFPKLPSQPRKNTRAELEARYAMVKMELQTREEDMLTLQRAYSLRCKQARVYARRAGAATVAMCDREQEELDLSLGLMRRHGSNVVSMAQRKRGRDGAT